MARAAAVALALALTACNGAVAGSDEVAITRAPSGLDLIPVTITQGSTAHRFQVEVARTTEEQARGLMNRTELPVDGGMLFPFGQPKFAAFWMRNTLIPLDMIFIRADGTIDRVAENTIPQTDDPVASGGLVSAVLELPGGTASRLGIDETGRVSWRGGPPPAR